MGRSDTLVFSAIKLHRKSATDQYMVDEWNLPQEVLIKFHFLTSSQPGYYWNKFVQNHPAIKQYHKSGHEKLDYVHPKNISCSNPRYILSHLKFEDYVEVFPNSQIFIPADNFKELRKIIQALRSGTKSISNKNEATEKEIAEKLSA